MRLTVQGWLNVVLAATGVGVLAGALVGAVMLHRTDQVTADLTEHIQPARAAAYQLQSALRDQETAIRGYAIAADRQFLAPYGDGQRAETAAAGDIRSLLAGRSEFLADLDAIEHAAQQWQSTYAAPLIVSVTPGEPALVDIRTAERGKTEFDRLRALFDTQNSRLEQARDTARAELGQM